MQILKEYSRKIFLLSGMVRDELILSDNAKTDLDHVLFLYLKNHLHYESVAFLDAKGIYFFESDSYEALNKKPAGAKAAPSRGDFSKLKGPKKRIASPQATALIPPIDEKCRYRISFNGNLIEMLSFALHHLKENKPDFALVIYDSTHFESFSPQSDVGKQFLGFLRNGIHQLPSENRNILIWVESDAPEVFAEKFRRWGFDFLFNQSIRDQRNSGLATHYIIPSSSSDEIIKAVSLHAIQNNRYPSAALLHKYAPNIAGILRRDQNSLRHLWQKLREEKDFWTFILKEYKIAPEKVRAWDELEAMTGFAPIKKRLKALINGIGKKAPHYEKDYELLPQRFLVKTAESLPAIPHLALLGNPGTGKTTVARLIGRILREEGILESGHLVEAQRADLVAGYQGQSALKTNHVIQSAMGGILFIDEAYNLINDERDSFGLEALATLIKAMSDYAGQWMLIFAGYPQETRKMLAYNPGAARRIEEILLPDYSAEELAQIMEKNLRESQLSPSAEIFEKAAVYCRNLLRERDKHGGNHFGNAGVIVNHIALACQNALAEKSASLLPRHFEFSHYFATLPADEEDLNQLIGLENIKSELKILEKRLKLEKNTKRRQEPGHYLFIGNPGTGKTIVAKQMAKRFYEIGLLKSNKMNTYSASQLIGKYMGDTSNRVLQILNEALDGVLFIDEAHQLVSDSPGTSYGRQALEAIVPFMENHRHDFSLIFAGYPQKMEALFTADPGLKGRFSQIFHFEDYSNEELLQILEKMIASQDLYTLAESCNGELTVALEKLRIIEGKNFANGRSVRKFLDNLKKYAIAEIPSNSEKVIINQEHIEQCIRNWK
jgi:SpoVK/Ycf46/Vps4 family AAA+-type ATPase